MKTNPISAAELMRRLQSDPNFARQNQERELKRETLEAELKTDEQPLLADLASIGKPIDSVWNLVNSMGKYREAIPVLHQHLSRPYHPKIREGIVRALTVPEARGVVAKDILRELERSNQKDEAEFRWALANALTVVADQSVRRDIETLITDQRFKDLHEILRLALTKI